MILEPSVNEQQVERKTVCKAAASSYLELMDEVEESPS
jgi:hypothetical protein